MDETYGFDFCAGDDALLPSVGKADYKDPACDLKDAAFVNEGSDRHGPKDQRQSSCDLRFGTSSGALGIRKFPNPRFNKAAWLKVNKGQIGTWSGYNAKMASLDPDLPELSRVMDPSVEPPFLIGLSCGACHIAFNPAKPPKDPAHPLWENISGTVGNQYARFSQILGSGMSLKSIEYQVFAHARPGAVDTSAIPTDQINNPGTMNALINLSKRPTFANEEVIKWRKAQSCPIGADSRSCWCEPGKEGKCWIRGKRQEAVHHILKGGEDTIGILEAIQRVYINIGTCSEESWANHLADLRQLDPTQRGFSQTPFDIGQTRRDCPGFRAVEDRLLNLKDFLLSAGTTDLYQSRGHKNLRDLTEQLDKEYGKGSVEQGKIVFAQNCAKCHSSQEGPIDGRDFRAVSDNPKDKGIRVDWLGNDQATPILEVGTSRARALHSNHMKGKVWEEYGSETLRAQKHDPRLKEPSDGGRGYYRNVSLLNAWAHAPFMHNNAMGPELCGGPEDEHYVSPYVTVAADGTVQALSNPPPCWSFDPSVEGRYKLYKASMEDLLSPNKRIPKVMSFSDDVVIKLFPKISDKNIERYISSVIVFPKGIPAARIGNFNHKAFAGDIILSRVDFKKLVEKRGEAIAKKVKERGDQLIAQPGRLIEVAGELRDVYSNSPTIIENEGHPFGEGLSDKDKGALIAFMATL
ncbi:MAG: cytochrome c [Nitrospirota bacterium]